MKIKSKQIIDRWIQFVNKRKLEELLTLYKERAIILPTFSQNMIDNLKDKRDYFSRLFARKKMSITLHEKSIKTQKISETTEIVTGLYCWKYLIQEELISFEAQFTFVLDLISPNPIIHHHSSQIPRSI